ncbi:T9SS type A sorting domain-containing protein [Spirosoma fluviale]|uniref:Delta-60 repeat domain-containing protein/Por secretion system C-terminal sorting domain-containing protein n=1 Tax=Spirosoma fluviale TaxID=1597977 RepID=A0A286GC17_9BACT|nr:T9SS type A sorting domain-containing protein [Spirosoma fluviale]SOD93050.1 delta-60 repeat domain-containing protein/Por secretion system C-terminal sorting domain-containing protein [Spirosoma fluviale]
MKKIYLLFFLGSLIGNVKGQSGTLDPSFGKNGTQTTALPINILQEQAVKVLPLTSGMYVVTRINSAVAVAKYLANGAIDSSYGLNGYSVAVDGLGLDAIMQNDGKVIVVTSSSVIRYTTNGTLDNSFSSDGIQTVPSSSIALRSVTIQGDKIVVAASRTSFSEGDFAVLRYNTDGSPDTSFSEDGLQTTDFGQFTRDNGSALVVQGDKILVAGTSNGYLALARYNTDGSPDTSFSQDGKVTYDNLSFSPAQSVAILGNKILVPGGVANDFAVVRYNSDGTLDTTFGTSGVLTTDMGDQFNESARLITIQGDKFVLTGNTNNGLGVVRYNSDGSLDTSFGNNGKVTTRFDGVDFVSPESVALQGDKLLVAGYVYTFAQSSAYDVALVRYNANGSLDTSLSDDGKLISFFPYARTYFTSSVVQPDGKVVAAGYTFMNLPGSLSDVFVVVRYNTDGTLDRTFSDDGIQTTDFGPGSQSTANAVMLQGNKIVLAGYSYNSDNNNNTDFAVARYNADGTPDNTFSDDGKQLTDLGPASNDFGQLVISQGDKIVVAGYSYNYETGMSITLTRYNANGSLDNTFSSDGIQTTNFGDAGITTGALALQGDKLLLAGTSYNLQTSTLGFLLARYNADGSLDTGFGDTGIVTTDFGPGSTVFAKFIWVQSDRILVAGYQGNDTQVAMARYKLDGTLDNSFGQNGKRLSPFPNGATTYITAMVGQDDGKFIVGGNTTDPATYRQTFALARYNPDGSLDTGFTGSTPSADNSTSYYLQALSTRGNRLYAVGYRQSSFFNGFGLGAMSEGVVSAYKLETNVSVSCPASKTVLADQGICGAVVKDIDPIGASSQTKYILSGATKGSNVGSASGKTFGIGATVVTYTQASEPSKTCSFTVTVVDRQAPTITGLSVSPNNLWPANHKMVDVTLTYNVLDNCKATAVVSVSSNEPQTGADDDTPEDWQIVDANHLKIRAERAGNGNGRIYTITLTATDASGNKTVQTTQVTVPKNNSGRVGADELSVLEEGEGVDGLMVKVMPNPSSSYFTVLTKRAMASVLTMRVSDLQGRMMQVLDNVPANGTMQLGHTYAPGAYVLTVIDGSKKVTVKLLKLAE